MSSRKKIKITIDYWLDKNPLLSVDECEQLRKEYMKTHNLLGRKGQTNGNSHITASSELRKSRSPMCLEFYICKYPNVTIEECENMLNNFKTKLRNKRSREQSKMCFEYWSTHYPDKSKEEQLQMYKNFQASNTLNKYIEKYGEEIGKLKFENRQKSWISKLQYNFELYGDGRCPQSKFANDIIQKITSALHIKPNKEKYINDKVGYAYDFCYGNKIIEFNGDYWHCNPKFYNNTFFNKSKNKTAEQIWKYDLEKCECASRHGYSVLTIWESEYKNNPEETIKKCIEFIK